jgi:2-polyprenyl-3-methyl-5-hydroxy-6-metoxy-1,4-benzoquinol methylase
MQLSIYSDCSALKRLRLIVDEIRDFSYKKNDKNISILDIGCGLGGMTFPISSLGYPVIGIDFDTESINSCIQRNRFSNAKYITADGETFELNEKFDVVISSEVLEHSPHPEMILKTIRKHLKKNGIAIVSVPNGFCFYEIVFSRFFQRIGLLNYFHKLLKNSYLSLTGSTSPYHSSNVYCNHVQFFKYNKFKELLKKCKFKILSIHNVSLGILLDWKFFKPLKNIECRLADSTAPEFAGGWVVVIKPKD